MLSGDSRRTLLAVMLSGLGLLAGAFAVRQAMPRKSPDPPIAVAKPEKKKVEGQRGENSVVPFDVINQGGADLVLGDVSTSCGCTVASVEPRIIKPGAKGTVIVTSEPPQHGSRTVNVQIKTNSEVTPELTLQLEVTASTVPPLVNRDSGAVHFGNIGRDGTASEPFQVETLEMAGTPPWIDRAVCSLKHASVTGKLEEEKLGPNGNMLRRYAYRVALERPMPPGPFRGELILMPREVGAAPVLIAPINGNVVPPVTASPSALYASLASLEERPNFVLILSTDDSGLGLHVEVPPSVREIVEIRKVTGDGGRRVVLELSAAPGFIHQLSNQKEPTRRTLVFKTNHPQCATVEIPLYIRYDPLAETAGNSDNRGAGGT